MTAYDDQVLADSPAGYWKMNEASGLPQDSSGNARHTTSTSGSMNYSFPSIHPDGTNSIELPFATSFFEFPVATFDASLAVTYEMWIKPVSVSVLQAVFGKVQDSSNVGLLTYMDTDRAMHSNINPNNLSSVGRTKFIAGRAFYVVLTCTTGASPTMTWYVDSILESSVVVATARNNTGNFRIGASLDSFWSGYRGSVSHLAVYQSVLSPFRVRAHYFSAFKTRERVIG